MITHKVRNELKQIIREVLVEQLNKSAFKADYKPESVEQKGKNNG